MLYRALTGRLPFDGRSLDVMMEKRRGEPPRPSARVPGVPEDLDTLCAGLLRLRPGDRPSARRSFAAWAGPPASPPTPSLSASTSRVRGARRAAPALADAFEATCRGRAVFVFVDGRSGVGKTAMVQRFLDGLAERTRPSSCRAVATSRSRSPTRSLDSLIDALSRYLRSLTRLKADALLPRDVAALGRVFPVLGRVDAVSEAPQRVSVSPDRQELRKRAFAALRETLTRIGDRQPLVLFIDDLQWGDLDSAAFLADLIRPPDPPRLLLIGSYRSEYADVSPFPEEHGGRVVRPIRRPQGVFLPRF